MPKYMKQKPTEIKWERDNFIMIVIDFNIPLSIIDRTRQQINKDIEDLTLSTNLT